MLISMPTCTSTIFGVFQVIPVSQVNWRKPLRHLKRKTARQLAQGTASMISLLQFLVTSSGLRFRVAAAASSAIG
jgi:hypothetical protein